MMFDRDEKAARWIALRQSGAMTAELEREYQSWLAADEKNRAEMAAYEASLRSVDLGGADLLAEEFERQLHEAHDQEHQRGARRGMRWQAIAASIAVLIVAGAGLYLAEPLTKQPVSYASGVGQQLNVALADGSTATLNTNSALAVDFSRERRGVKIAQGEALFDVTKDASRPFVVQTPVATIEVIGTVFSVRALPQETSISVVSGRVNVNSKGGSEIVLTAGQKFEIDAGGGERTISFDPQRELAWRAGRARYQDELLEDVVADLNRYFPKPIALGDSSLQNAPVTGEFDVTDQETAVAALAAAFDLRPSEDAQRILLSPASP
jgi:transmembrane sensor